MIRALRSALGWTQPDLARALGVGLRTVARWEADGAPRHVELLARMLCAMVDRDGTAAVRRVLFDVQEPAPTCPNNPR